MFIGDARAKPNIQENDAVRPGDEQLITRTIFETPGHGIVHLATGPESSQVSRPYILNIGSRLLADGNGTRPVVSYTAVDDGQIATQKIV